jgi:hypothetical protein
MGDPFTPGTGIPPDSFVLRPEAYMGYYRALQKAERRFAGASPEEREAACVLSMKAAHNLTDQPQDDAGEEAAYVVSRHATHSS